jgi:timeless
MIAPGTASNARADKSFSLFKITFQEWDNREEEDTLLIERVLLLLRNILHVPADPKAEKV